MRFRFLLLALVGAALTFGQPVNAPEQQDKPYVLLVSLDGFRYDFAAKYGAKTLVRFGGRGVAAKALIPSYPSSTFPNHYSIVTGLYPQHHGIVEGEVNLRKVAPLQGVHVAGGASQVMLYSKDQALIDASYTALKDKDPRINVYRRSETLEHLHYRDSGRIANLVIEAAAPVHIDPLSAHILGLKTPAVDGSLSVLAPMLSRKAA